MSSTNAMPLVPRRRAATSSRAAGRSMEPSTAMISPEPATDAAVSEPLRSSSMTASAASTSSSISRPIASTAPVCVFSRIWWSALSRCRLIDAASVTAVSRLDPAPSPAWALARWSSMTTAPPCETGSSSRTISSSWRAEARQWMVRMSSPLR